MDNPLPFYRDKLVQCFILVMLAIVAATLYIRHLNEPAPPPVGLHVEAKPAKEVAAIPKVTAPIKSGSVRVYASRGKANLKLPAHIADDPLQMVLESNQVKADDHPQTVTTVIDTDTGETKTFVRRDPLPWLAWDDHGEVGLYAGVKNGTPTARLEAKQGIFQMKAVHVGVIGSVDQPISGPISADYYVGVGAWYRW